MTFHIWKSTRHHSACAPGLLYRWHLDGPILFTLLTISLLGLFILWSATNQDESAVLKQLTYLALGFGMLFIFAQIPPRIYQRFAPAAFGMGILLLLLVFLMGDIGKGARRWLSIGGLRFQPSELSKLALPLILAWYLQKKSLPLRLKEILTVLILTASPVLLIMEQPDLGTAILIGASGFFVLLFAGITWSFLGIVALVIALSFPLLWLFLHDYQKQRILTFFNPESDPLGSGWNIIQSKIAIGSGGFLGKGWLHGSQSRLDFLPEGATDFIFAVWSEELGFLGVTLLLALYLIIVIRSLYLGTQAQDTFSRMYMGCLALSFFGYVFINIGMVSGLLPVVGIPLPLVSLGGTSAVTLLAGFGILMSLSTHKRLLG